jgi:GT2 family glycosyltransferase
VTVPVTIVVVPRERFSLAERSLESLYEHTAHPFSLVYVDGRSPRHIKRYLETQAREKGFELIRAERYLSQNQARNLGLRRVNSPYVVFTDNDVLFSPGWLDALVRCAEETGAWVVGPMYCIGEPALTIVHCLSGTASPESAWRRSAHSSNEVPASWWSFTACLCAPRCSRASVSWTRGF